MVAFTLEAWEVGIGLLALLLSGGAVLVSVVRGATKVSLAVENLRESQNENSRALRESIEDLKRWLAKVDRDVEKNLGRIARMEGKLDQWGDE